MWTKFTDMFSGGEKKEQWDHIFIEETVDKAVSVFYNRFKHNPYTVTCECCGPDYEITTGPSLESLTAYERNYFWNRHSQKWEERKHGVLFKSKTLEEYKQTEEVLFIYSLEIKEHELYTPVSRNG